MCYLISNQGNSKYILEVILWELRNQHLRNHQLRKLKQLRKLRRKLRRHQNRLRRRNNNLKTRELIQLSRLAGFELLSGYPSFFIIHTLNDFNSALNTRFSKGQRLECLYGSRPGLIYSPEGVLL